MNGSRRSVPDWVASLATRGREIDGQPPFSDQALVDYRLGDRELIAIDELAAALASDTEAEFIVSPDARGRGLGTRLLETLLARAPGELLLWSHGDHPAARALAASHGLSAVRELLHLTGDVPATGPAADPRIRPFRPGADEEAWVAVNARAFAGHPEQGRVTRADLEQLMAEPWFDPDDFLLLRDDDEVLGYCWLKVEGDEAEFYVVGVSPDHRGEGLGGRLVDAGFERMRERGIRRSHLYVDGDNSAALRLYRARGFVDDTIDVQYSSAGANDT